MTLTRLNFVAQVSKPAVSQVSKPAGRHPVKKGKGVKL
jgi:hypothetical protein